jgi:hypothetical protein
MQLMAASRAWQGLADQVTLQSAGVTHTAPNAAALAIATVVPHRPNATTTGLPPRAVSQTPPPGPRPIDARALFDKEPRTPIPAAEISDWHFAARDSHSIDHIHKLPDGTQLIAATSFKSDAPDEPAAYLSAVKPDASIAWTYDIPLHRRLSAVEPRSDGGAIVVTEGRDSYDSGEVIAVDAHGKPQWTLAGEWHERFDSAKPGPNGTTYVKSGDQVRCFNPDGSVKWKKKLSIHSDSYFHIVTGDGTQLFANDNFSNNFGDDTFVAISPDGKMKRVRLPNITSFPLQTDTQIIYAGEDGKLHGVDTSTWKSWEVQTDSERGLSTPWLGRDGNIYVQGRHDERLYAVSPQGAILWRRVVDDATTPDLVSETGFQTTAGGYVYYMQDGGDRIQDIGPDGRPGRGLAVPEGVRSFARTEDGQTMVWTYSDELITYDPSGHKRNAIPLEVEHPQLWHLRDASNDGHVVLARSDEIHQLRALEDPYLQRALERAEQNPPDPPSTPDAPRVERGDDYVDIGGVRVPVRKTEANSAQPADQ